MLETIITFNNHSTIKVQAQIFVGRTLISTCLAGPGESHGLTATSARYDIFFKNGATLGGIISVPGGPDTVDAKGLSEQFEARHSGEGKWWKPAVLTGGATFDSMTPTPKEAELGPLYQQAVEVAARFFHIPPHLLASQMAGAVSYASVEQRSIEYVQHGVVPITTRIERVLSRLLPGDRYVKLNVTSLLRGDATARAEFYRTLAELKVMTPKQIAALEDLPVDLATDGFHETPNNNGIPDRSAPAEPARGLGLSLDARVDDVALSVLADTQRDIVEQNTQRLAEQAARDREASRIEREAQRREIAELRAAFVEATRPAPAPVIDIRRDEHGRAQEVYERRGDEVIRKVITHDEDGRIVGVRVA